MQPTVSIPDRLRRVSLGVFLSMKSTALYSTAGWIQSRFAPRFWNDAITTYTTRRTLRLKGQRSIVIDFPGFQMDLDLAEATHDLVHYCDWKRHGSYEPGVTRLISSLLRPGANFVDGGANSGFFSLLAARCVGPNGKVWGFEPTPRARNRFIHNVHLNNLSNVTVFASALAATNGERSINISKTEDGLNSFSQIPGAAGTIVVKTQRLDSILENERVDLIKLDVEGAEADALAGAEGLFRANPHCCVVLEHNFFILGRNGSTALFKTLSALGLRAFELGRNGVLPTQVRGPEDLAHLSTMLYCQR